MATTQSYSTSSAGFTSGPASTGTGFKGSNPPGMVLGEIHDPPPPSGPSETGKQTSENTERPAKLNKTPRFREADTNTSKGASEDARSRGEEHSGDSVWDRSKRMAQGVFNSLNSGTKTGGSNAGDTSNSSRRPPAPTVEDDTDVRPEETRHSSGKGTRSSWSFSPERRMESPDSYLHSDSEPSRGRTNKIGAEMLRPGYERNFENSTEDIRRKPLRPQTPFNPYIPSDSDSDDGAPSEKDPYMMSGANPDAVRGQGDSYNDTRMGSEADTGTTPVTGRIRRRLHRKPPSRRRTDGPTDIFESMDRSYGGYSNSHYYGGHPWSSMGPPYHYGPPPVPSPWGYPSMGPYDGWGGGQPSWMSMGPGMSTYGPPGSGWEGGPSSAWNQDPSTQPGFWPPARPKLDERLKPMTKARIAIQEQKATARAATSNVPTTAPNTVSLGASQPSFGPFNSFGGQSNVNDLDSPWPHPRYTIHQGKRVVIPPWQTLQEALSTQGIPSNPSFGGPQVGLDSRFPRDRMVSLPTNTGQFISLPVPANMSAREVLQFL